MTDVALDILTHSAMTAYKRCRKLYWFRYEQGLRPAVDAHALRFGTVMHAAIDYLQCGGTPEQITEWVRSCDLGDPFSPRTAAALFWGYAQRWASCPIIETVVRSEARFDIPLRNPESGSPSRTWSLAGKLDAIVITTNGETALKETKTTSDDITDDHYWRRLLMDPQVSLYWIAAEASGHKVETIVYDVIRKPGMRPARATPMESRKYKKDGGLYANQREADETPDEWEARLFADIAERPDHYYARREIPRLDADLEAFRQETWDVAKDIAESRKTRRWYRNVSRFNCDDCAYFGICTGMELWDGVNPPAGFTIVDDVHPELSGESK